jgi:hypothetical protein
MPESRKEWIRNLRYPSMGKKNKAIGRNNRCNQMMNVSFAQSMRTQFADSYKRDGPAEIIPGTGIMNYHLTDSKKNE